MSSFLSTADFDRVAGTGTAAALGARQVPVGSFEWLVPVRRLRKSGGEELTDVFCGAAGGQLFAFPLNGGFRRLAVRHLGLGDWECKQMPLSGTHPAVEHRGEQIVLTAAFVPTGPVERLEIVLDEKTLLGSVGPWLSAWGAATGAAAGSALPPLPLGVMNWRRWRLAENSFGPVASSWAGLTLCGVTQGQWVVYPFRPMPALEGQSWTTAGEANPPGTRSLWALGLDAAGLPEMVQWQEHLVSGESPLVAAMSQWLTEVPRAEHTSAWRLKDRGVYPLSLRPKTPPRATVLCREPGGILLAERAGEPGREEDLRFVEAFAWEGQTVLVDAEGRTGQVAVPAVIAQALAKELRAPDRLGDGAVPGESWTVGVVRNDHQEVGAPRKIVLNAYEARVGENRLPFAEPLRLEAEVMDNGLGRLRLWPGGSENGAGSPTTHPWEIILPAKVAFILGETWEVARAEFHNSTASATALYQEFNDAKKYNLLCALFADVVALNRQLNAGVSMADLIGRLAGKGAAEFSADKELHKQTLAKIITLSVALPEIKRNFEQWAALYPYYWVQQDMDWVGSVFGEATGRELLPAQRKRSVPLIRQAVRAAQAGLQRALDEIEAAIRPLEQTLAREEVQNHWMHKVRQYAMPAGTIAGTLKLAATGAAMLNPLVLGSVSIVLLAHVAGKLSSDFMSSREEDAIFQRVAKNVLPWWQVFMRNLEVSIYETAQFVDEENLRAMTLDEELLERQPAGQQHQTRLRIAEKLRERIIAEKRRGFTELLEGSGVRVRHLVEDLRRSTSEETVHLDALTLPLSAILSAGADPNPPLLPIPTASLPGP